MVMATLIDILVEKNVPEKANDQIFLNLLLSTKGKKLLKLLELVQQL